MMIAFDGTVKCNNTDTLPSIESVDERPLSANRSVSRRWPFASVYTFLHFSTLERRTRLLHFAVRARRRECSRRLTQSRACASFERATRRFSAQPPNLPLVLIARGAAMFSRRLTRSYVSTRLVQYFDFNEF